MRKLLSSIAVTSLVCFIASIALAKDDKAGHDHKDKKSDQHIPPQLEAFKKQLDAISTDKLKQLAVTQRAELQQWCRKNNFQPPDLEEPGRGGGKERAGGKGKNDRNKVAISKRKEAELMAEYVPAKARLDLIERTVREREQPKKEERPRKDK